MLLTQKLVHLMELTQRGRWLFISQDCDPLDCGSQPFLVTELQAPEASLYEATEKQEWYQKMTELVA